MESGIYHFDWVMRIRSLAAWTYQIICNRPSIGTLDMHTLPTFTQPFNRNVRLGARSVFDAAYTVSRLVGRVDSGIH